MRAVLTAGVAAIEACAVALAVLALIAVCAVLLWWLGFGLAAAPEDLAAATGGIWMLAHFVPMSFALDPEAAIALGLAPEALEFTLSLAPLGVTLITVLLAFRSGWRFGGRGQSGAGGVLGGALGFAASAYLVTLVSAPLLAWPVWLAVLVPTLCYGVAAAAGFVGRSAVTGLPWWEWLVRQLQRAIEPLSAVHASAFPARARETFVLAAALLAAVLALGALGVAVAVIAGYVEIVTLSQALQLDVLGVVLLFVLNIALLPVACIWAVAWLSGAGFALGAGTSVSPFETLLGPVPALPLFGAVPQGWGSGALLAPLLLVLLGVVLGAMFGGARHSSWVRAVAVPLVAATFVGLAVVVLAVFAGGSMGPGRLTETGPHPWVTGGLVAAELAVGLLIGVFTHRADLRRRLAPVWGRGAGLAPQQPEVEGTVPVSAPVPVPVAAPEAAPLPTPVAAPGPESAEAETVPLDPLLVSHPGTSDPDTSDLTAPHLSETAEIIRAYGWDDQTHQGADTDERADRAARADRASRWHLPWRKR